MIERMLEKAFMVLVWVCLFAIFGFPMLAVGCYTISLALNFLAAMTTEDWAVGIFIIVCGTTFLVILNAWRYRYDN